MIPIKILVVGDTHGGAGVVARKLKIASDLGCDRILIVGDFGMWPGTGGIQFLDQINNAAMLLNIDIFVLRGNHDDTVQWNYHLDNSPKNNDGFSYVRSRVLIAPTIHFWSWDKKRFAIAAGAVSVDKKFRKIWKSWWPDEAFSEENLKSVLRYKGKGIDYLFTHDASDYTEWGYNLIPDPDSQSCRQRIDKVIAHLRPGKHFHGHMHHKYYWVNRASHGRHYSAFGIDDSQWNGAETETFGLAEDNEDNSFVLLDTEKNEVFWPGKAFALYGK